MVREPCSVDDAENLDHQRASASDHPVPALSNPKVQLVEQRRQAMEQELWSIPAISIAAQAFLFTTGLAADTRPAARLILGVIGLVTALGTLLAILRQAGRVDIGDQWMEMHDAPSVWDLKRDVDAVRPAGQRRGLLDRVPHWLLGSPDRWQLSNGHIWGGLLVAFAVADLLVIFSSVGGLHLLHLAR